MGRTAAEVSPLVERLFRDEAGRLIALLTRLLGPAHLALAEDVTQEAFIAALGHWPRTGVPENPSAWLLQVARRKALDALRREQVLEERLPAIAAELEEAEAAPAATHGVEDGPFADDRLRMILLCCHPAVSEDSRIALTLKVVSGFSVGEIARAFLADEPAIAQRLVRAKRALRDASATFDMPEGADLAARLDAVHAVLYLMFNEGHTAHEGAELLRRDLSAEAIRLAERLAAAPGTSTPATHALAALFYFHASRFDARTDGEGRLLTLQRQDRSKWDAALVARAFHHLDLAADGDRLTSYHIEAEIASVHSLAPSWEATDWGRIVACYDRLVDLTKSQVVALNRVVAVRELRGAAAALTELDAIVQARALDSYHLYHAVRAELFAATGDSDGAARAWERARELVRSAPIQRHIDQRLAELVDSRSLPPS